MLLEDESGWKSDPRNAFSVKCTLSLILSVFLNRLCSKNIQRLITNTFPFQNEGAHQGESDEISSPRQIKAKEV